MGSLDLQLWTRLGTMNLRPRASVLDCASPLALFDPPGLLKSKRQRTGAVQNLAALRRFMERENAANGESDHLPAPWPPRYPCEARRMSLLPSAATKLYSLIGADVRSRIQATSRGARKTPEGRRFLGIGLMVSLSTHLRISAWPSAKEKPPAAL